MGCPPVLGPVFAGFLFAIPAGLVADPGPGPDSSALAGTATITGSVKFEGKAPKRRPIDMGAQEYCTKAHPTPVLSETVIVNENGTLRNVFVYVKKGLSQQEWPVPSEPVVLEQKGCTYAPHVFGIQLGQPLKVRNGDDTMHNIHGFPKKNAEFNFSQTNKGQETEVKFTQPEVMVTIKCDVHGWMGSYAGVLRHPFFSVTGEDGAFKIANLPPGEYTLEAWHEEYGKQESAVKVGDGETREVSFTFRKS